LGEKEGTRGEGGEEGGEVTSPHIQTFCSTRKKGIERKRKKSTWLIFLILKREKKKRRKRKKANGACFWSQE